MDKYLISVDLDDTLLTSEKIITQRSREYIRKITNEGHRFIINTGRPFQGAVRYLKALGICEPMVVNNGGAIVYFDETYSEIVMIFLWIGFFELVFRLLLRFKKKGERKYGKDHRYRLGNDEQLRRRRDRR